MRRSHLRAMALVVLPVAGLLVGCRSGSSSHIGASVTRTSAWVDQPVSFAVGGLTIYGTYRHPRTHRQGLAAALLIAGSGPTDRNGNTPLLPGSIDILKTIAEWLSADGVASLRYDKLGSGRTGLGRYASNPDAIGTAPFEQEATAALRFLARQPGIDRNRLAVIGHSEGALFALLLATGASGPAPSVRAIGLLEPLSERYLDVIRDQVDAQAAAAVRAGRLTSGRARAVERLLNRAIASLRRTGRVPADLLPGLAQIVSPVTALFFLSRADRFDPAQLASRLPAHLRVLLTCSDADTQVTCAEVEHLVAGLRRGRAKTDFVRLTGVDHVLKEDATRSAANYTAPLPFSTQLQKAMRAFIQANL
jgi:alpha-beta hydrolase superfamily lysophospholipase